MSCLYNPWNPLDRGFKVRFNKTFEGKFWDLPDQEMRQLTIPRGSCKRSSENIPIFSFLWQRPCTYRQAACDWGVHCNDGKLNQFFLLQICSPPCPAVQLIALEITNLEDRSKYKYNPSFKNILGCLFHEGSPSTWISHKGFVKAMDIFSTPLVREPFPSQNGSF